MFEAITKDYTDRESWHRTLVELRRSLPLLAALIAPLSVLLDIPALSQPWYGSEEQRITDDVRSLVLSAFSLFFNVVANILLMMRFSVKTDRAAKLVTRWSTVFWILKPVIAISNLVVFGIYRRKADGAFFLEGFWCAVVSCVLAAISASCLLINYAFEANTRVRLLNKETRSRGRGFMINVTLFVSTIAVQALIFSRIEGWTYLSGIYFSTVSILTVGFGDFVPTTTAGKILLFPVAVVGIIHLATIVSSIIAFFNSRTANRHKEARRKYRTLRLERERAVGRADLFHELTLLEQHQREETRDAQIVDLFYSVFTFFALWLLGALIFSRLEGWSYGNSLYFNSVFFLSIGFGDFAPETSAGRVVFIVYAMLCVPVIASFVVQTLSSTLDVMRGQWRAKKKEKKPRKLPTPHTELVRAASQELQLKRARSFADSNLQVSKDSLGDELVEVMLMMDVQTRKLLNMTLTGHDRLVLRADTLVQARNSDRSHEIAARVFDAEDVSAELSRYRGHFAQAVALASAFKDLSGEERRAFERVAHTPIDEGEATFVSNTSIVSPGLSASSRDSFKSRGQDGSSEGTRVVTFLED